jgi:hypothetical protein
MSSKLFHIAIRDKLTLKIRDKEEDFEVVDIFTINGKPQYAVESDDKRLLLSHHELLEVRI